MKGRLFTVLLILSIVWVNTFSQTATDLNEGSTISYSDDPFLGRIYRLEWWGRSGWTYFTQVSEDLVNWTYFDEIDSGNDAVDGIYMTTSGDKIFGRIQYTDQPTSDPINDDFDGDHISNWQEITMSPIQGNPLDASSIDGDLIPDDWERFHGLDAEIADGDLDSDNDRLSNYLEFLSDTDPWDDDTDGDFFIDGWEVTYGLDPNFDEGITLDDSGQVTQTGPRNSLV